ncbi:PREDICTED: uncharacterized protein LOC101310049 [Fragaria vesca subsp. vesca]
MTLLNIFCADVVLLDSLLLCFLVQLQCIDYFLQIANVESLAIQNVYIFIERLHLATLRSSERPNYALQFTRVARDQYFEGQNLDKQQGVQRWQAPSDGVLKLNVAGALLPNGLTRGIGGVLRNHTGNFVAVFAHKVQFVSSAKQTELVAIKQGLKMLQDKHISVCIVESDCLTDVQDLQQEDHLQLEFGNLLDDIKRQLQHNNGVNVVFAPRTANAVAVAHRLAAEAFESSQNNDGERISFWMTRNKDDKVGEVIPLLHTPLCHFPLYTSQKPPNSPFSPDAISAVPSPPRVSNRSLIPLPPISTCFWNRRSRSPAIGRHHPRVTPARRSRFPKQQTSGPPTGLRYSEVVERESEELEARERNEREEEEEEEEMRREQEKKDAEGFEQQQQQQSQRDDVRMSMLQRLNPTNPLRIAINPKTRSAAPPPPPPMRFQQAHNPRSTPTPQPSITTLNSRKYTNKFSLFLFVVHMVAAIGLVGFLLFKGVQGLIKDSGSVSRKEKRVLRYFLPQVEAASLMSITLAFAWQKAYRKWPKFMVHFILWTTFVMTLSAGILLICFQKPATTGVGVCLIGFAIGNSLYACWITPRIGFCSKVLIKSLEPVSKFPDLNQPTYWMLGIGFLWMSLWILAVIGSMNFYFTPLVIILLVLSLCWTAEVMRNVANITVSRVIALYYLRGMQSNTQFCFQRALSKSLGSACFGSLFVPAIEALRIVARALNLLEGEDEFMFSCAHCCLHVMQSIFRYGNGWAFVQIAAYGKDFVRASQETWELFERQEGVVHIVDSDITSSICFLTGVCSGSMCVIVVAAWTARVHLSFMATISLLAFFIGYLMTRIAMALPHACVGCYYVCWAENPDNRLFDKTMKDRLALMNSGRDILAATPRVPHRFAAR